MSFLSRMPPLGWAAALVAITGIPTAIIGLVTGWIPAHLVFRITTGTVFVVLLLALILSFRAGRISLGHGDVSHRDRDPFGFWLAVVLMLALIIWTGALTISPDLMDYFTRLTGGH